VKGLERLPCEKNVAALYGQASGCEAQARDEQEWVNLVKSWDEFIDRQQCDGSLRQTDSLCI